MTKITGKIQDSILALLRDFTHNVFPFCISYRFFGDDRYVKVEVVGKDSEAYPI